MQNLSTWIQSHFGMILAIEILVITPLLVLAPLAAVLLFGLNPPKLSLYYSAAIAAIIVAITIILGSGFTLSGGVVSLVTLGGGIVIGGAALLWIMRMAMK